MKTITYKQLEQKLRDGKVQMMYDLMGTYKNIAQVQKPNGKIENYNVTGTMTQFFLK